MNISILNFYGMQSQDISYFVSISNLNPIVQALLASLFTWGLTAVGAAAVFLLEPHSRKVLDVSLGFAAGVMTAASFWSLLAPAIDIAQTQLGSRWAFIPVSVGFVFGSAFVLAADRLMPFFGFTDASVIAMLKKDTLARPCTELDLVESVSSTDSQTDNQRYECQSSPNTLRWRRTRSHSRINTEGDNSSLQKKNLVDSWRRIALLILAVTVHNIPEGLAVGVAFGSIGSTNTATFQSAVNLALGIGLQNFPEGLAVSLPLASFGYSLPRAFWYGQLSGMVEPLAALLGATTVLLMRPVLPYALSFAAGAMIFVVIDDIVPEAQRNGNGRHASLGSIVGFIVMMALDVGLG